MTRLLRALCVLPLLVAAVTAGLAVYLVVFIAPAGAVAAHVSVGGTPVDGSTAADLSARLSHHAEVFASRPVSLLVADGAYVTTWPDLGVTVDVTATLQMAMAQGRDGSPWGALAERWALVCRGADVPIALAFDDAKARALLETVGSQMNRAPVDAEIRYDGEKLSIVSDARGRRIGTRAAVTLLAECAASGECPSALELPIADEPARFTAQEAARYRVLGEFTTHFSVWQTNRSENIRVASATIDGATVPPGWVFSLNGATGERTPDKGYRLAPVYSGQETIVGYGGGVCQISSTIYNAVLHARQRVVERHGHSKPVHYVEWGRDATVSWGDADFRFQNMTGAPLTLRAWVDEGSLSVALIGKPRSLREQSRGPRSPLASGPDGWETVAARPQMPGYVAPSYPPAAFVSSSPKPRPRTFRSSPHTVATGDVLLVGGSGLSIGGRQHHRF